MLIAIACVDANGVIGQNGQLAYKIPADQLFFKTKTKNHAVLVGKNTFEEVKDLKDRDWVVLQRQDYIKTLEYCAGWATDVFLGGGAEIYRVGLPYCQEALISRPDITKEFDGDLKYFPTDLLEGLFKKTKVEQRRGFTLERWEKF
jgi:dihydrofolate reductase